MDNNIILIGPMGAGKSTIGRQLAKSLHKKFYDSDTRIEERTGVDIPTIFDIEGEQGFRDREVQTIDELTQFENIVLATGGGAVLREENRRHMKSRGVVVYLKTSVEQQLERTRYDRNRPLLATEDPGKKLAELLQIREPLYMEAADIVIETDNRQVFQVVREIKALLNEKDG